MTIEDNLVETSLIANVLFSRKVYGKEDVNILMTNLNSTYSNIAEMIDLFSGSKMRDKD